MEHPQIGQKGRQTARATPNATLGCPFGSFIVRAQGKCRRNLPTACKAVQRSTWPCLTLSPLPLPLSLSLHLCLSSSLFLSLFLLLSPSHCLWACELFSAQSIRSQSNTKSASSCCFYSSSSSSSSPSSIPPSHPAASLSLPPGCSCWQFIWQIACM